MQAIILAAGMGKRLKELTKNNTKCMVKVNGVTLIDRMLHQIDEQHLSRVVIVVGYEGKKLIDYIGTLGIKTPITYVNNSIYDKTNNIYSLSLAKDFLCDDDTLLFESDIIFEDSVIDELVNDPRDTLALVDKYESWMDGTCVKLSDDDSIEAFVPGSKFKFNEIDEYYKTVNIYKFSKHFSQTHYVPFLDAYSKALGNNEYYEQVLRVITMLDDPEIKAKRLSGQRWYEIDDVQDLDIATSMFAPNLGKKLSLMQGRYGGYWRYPQLIDYCYLVNPYYPPQKLVDEIKASFDKLLTQYPSGMHVNSLLASKNFGVHQDNIIVGNGAAELIKSLMERLSGECGFVRPTFEEYPNRFATDESVIFTPDNKKFSYSAEVMKSISKSFGVPGLRLGVLASGNTDTIRKMKKDVAIWNINSFAEFYMQIEEKYKKDYLSALEKLRKERTRFQSALSEINGIRVIPSQANYVMVELENYNATELTKVLFDKYNLLIKDLSSKTNSGQFVRLAVRNTDENNVLIAALQNVLE